MKITDEAVEVAERWFNDNFNGIPDPKSLVSGVLTAALPHLSQGAVGVKADAPEQSDAERVSKLLGTAIDGQVVVAAMEDGDYGDSPFWLWRNHETNVTGFGRWAKENGQAPYIRADIAIKGILSALSRAPVGVTGEVTYEIENEEGEFCAGADSLADAQHYATIYEQDHPVRLVEVTRRVISSPFALASHEPEPAPTDTQEGLSVTGEVVAWAYEHHDFGDIWPRGVILNRPDGGANPPTAHHGSPVRNVTPLVRQSALTACHNEIERLTDRAEEAEAQVEALQEKNTSLERDPIGLRERRRADTAEARIFDLEQEVERLRTENARLSRTMREDMVPISADGKSIFIDGAGDVEIDHQGKLRTRILELGAVLEEVKQRCLVGDDAGISVSEDVVIESELFSRICAALGGQSNE